MSNISLEGNASGTGTFTIAAPNTNSNYTITLPQASGTIITTAGGAAISGTTGDFSSTIKGGSTISVGGATPSTSGAGITFPATQSASTNANTLDDYEEGTFTPAVDAFTVTGTTTLTGRYVKVGKMVSILITFENTGTIAYGVSANVGSFPFSGVANTGSFTMRIESNSLAQNSNQSGVQMNSGEANFTRFFVGNFTTSSAGQRIVFNGVYEATA